MHRDNYELGFGDWSQENEKRECSWANHGFERDGDAHELGMVLILPFLSCFLIFPSLLFLHLLSLVHPYCCFLERGRVGNGRMVERGVELSWVCCLYTLTHAEFAGPHGDSWGYLTLHLFCWADELRDGPPIVSDASDFDQMIYWKGFLCWGLSSCLRGW